MLFQWVGFVSQQRSYAFFVRGFGCALFIFTERVIVLKYDNLKTDVSKRLRFFRNLKGVSAKQMSLDIGRGETYISKIENGQTLPSLEAFADIVRYIGISCDFFFKANI